MKKYRGWVGYLDSLDLDIFRPNRSLADLLRGLRSISSVDGNIGFPGTSQNLKFTIRQIKKPEMRTVRS
jgi:hypothetical protein